MPLNKDIIEQVETSLQPTGLVHYIPHHAVIKPDKSTTKLRIVYDASAKPQKANKSLNNCLYRGPVMLNDLTGIMLRFRTHPIAVVSDIENAFLKVGLQENQRDVTRFFWLKDINNPVFNDSNIQEYRFARVPFGVVSGPFLLGATVDSHLSKYESDMADMLKRDIYVDNLITGVQSTSEAERLYKESKQMFSDCAMNLREWLSNCKTVKDSFAECDKARETTTKVLGYIWDLEKDTLGISLPNTDCLQGEITKRSVLRYLPSVFDPLGQVCPVVLRGNVMLQNLWIINREWDQPLPDDEVKVWNNVQEDLKKITQCQINRNISLITSNSVTCSLFCFCDASEKAYAAAIYLYQTDGCRSRCDLVFAKTRLAPTKTVSIPRLELLAVLIGVKCMTFMKRYLNLPVCRMKLWTDSQCVLHWIKSAKELPTFVKNRVKEIRSYDNIEKAYVCTSENPADVATRGTSIDKLIANECWWSGPKWILLPESSWPDQQHDHKETASEITVFCVDTDTRVEAAKLHTNDKNTNICSQIDINRFGSIQKLLRVTVLVLRFVNKLRKRNTSNGYLTSSEINEAENMWIESVQGKHYADVFRAILTGKRSCFQSQLGVYVDDTGILRSL